MADTPTISVVLPVYNAELYLKEAIDSILRQTFSDFELIIINDGSSDGSASILEQYRMQDARVHIITLEKNGGLIGALNTGCQAAIGSYIAIMHADDISLPLRFERQVAYLEAHPDHGIIGSWIQLIDKQGWVTQQANYPAKPALLKWLLPFYSPLAHPAVIMRRQVIAPLGFYQEGQLVVEDYDLWARAAEITRLGNVPEVLLQYRISGDSWSDRNKALQQLNSAKIAASVAGKLVGEVDLGTMQQLADLAMDKMPPTLADTRKIAILIEKLYSAFIRHNRLSREEKQAVSRDAANKMLVLAAHVWHFSPLAAINFVKRALFIAPPSLNQLERGIRRLRAGNRGSFYAQLPKDSR